MRLTASSALNQQLRYDIMMSILNAATYYTTIVKVMHLVVIVIIYSVNSVRIYVIRS